mmetsp:Transcript_3814/g.5693  ORF Transcript_3814/g.5693 Transcript_3814/m.5693 type:complete len:307 (-) Transcript_3814:156-1076(-)
MTEVMPHAQHPPSGEEYRGVSWGMQDFKSIARTIRTRIPIAIDGLADIIHRSALNLAEEFANLEREAALEASRWRDGYYEQGDSDQLPLPWEIPCGGTNNNNSNNSNSNDGAVVFVPRAGLKEKILSLSSHESNFVGPFTDDDHDDQVFKLDEKRIHLIHRLFFLDRQLAARHADSAGGIKEETFWRNYFYHCDQAAMEYRFNNSARGCSATSTTTTTTSPQTPPLLLLQPTDDNSFKLPNEDSSSSAQFLQDFVDVQHGDDKSVADSQRDTLSLGDVVLVGGAGEDLNDFLVDDDDVVFGDEGSY